MKNSEQLGLLWSFQTLLQEHSAPLVHVSSTFVRAATKYVQPWQERVSANSRFGGISANMFILKYDSRRKKPSLSPVRFIYDFFLSSQSVHILTDKIITFHPSNIRQHEPAQNIWPNLSYFTNLDFPSPATFWGEVVWGRYNLTQKYTTDQVVLASHQVDLSFWKRTQKLHSADAVLEPLRQSSTRIPEGECGNGNAEGEKGDENISGFVFVNAYVCMTCWFASAACDAEHSWAGHPSTLSLKWL